MQKSAHMHLIAALRFSKEKQRAADYVLHVDKVLPYQCPAAYSHSTRAPDRNKNASQNNNLLKAQKKHK